jgi:hypothetical protein
MLDINRPQSITLLAVPVAACPLVARVQRQSLRKTLTKRLIAAALMLPTPNAYTETQAATHMITTAAAISLYKIHFSGKIPASAVEMVNTTVREYRQSRVVASMAELNLQREKLGDAGLCVHVEKHGTLEFSYKPMRAYCVLLWLRIYKPSLRAKFLIAKSLLSFLL